MSLKRNLYSCLCLVLVLCSCQYFKSDHPQAALIDQSTTTGMNEKSVIAFAEDIEHSKDNLKRLSSLVYKRGQDELFVENYFNEHGDEILIEYHQTATAMDQSSRRFYFKNDSLILVTASGTNNQSAKKSYTESRTYLRNYTVFKKEIKSAESVTELVTAAFQPEDAKQVSTEDYKGAIDRLRHALNRTDEFELVFDRITEFPDATFLELTSKVPNGYTASIELEAQDAFVDSLKRDPLHFKNNKINFNWKVVDMQAIYVPSGSTSAKGLNR